MADRNFGKESTAEEVTEGIDLTGRTALVTGASSGLGAETARVLAARRAAVTLTGRSAEKTEQVAAGIRESTGNNQVDVQTVSLDRPDSVRDFAKTYLASHPELHLLINNAGVMACPLSRTPEGWERVQFSGLAAGSAECRQGGKCVVHGDAPFLR